MLSDIHGNLPALEAALEDARQQADAVVFAGDLGWGGPFPAEVVARLRDLGYPCVVGNTDRALLQAPASHPYARWAHLSLAPEDLEYLQRLPIQHWIDLAPLAEPPVPAGAAGSPARRLLVVHSAPDDPERTLPDPTQEAGLERLFGAVPAACVVHGHDHRPSVVHLERLTVAGAGSVGMPFDGDPRACYAVVEYEPGRGIRVEHRRVRYDVDAAARGARERQMPGADGWIASVCRGLPPGRTTL